MDNVTIYCFLASYAVAFALELTRLFRQIAIRQIVVLAFTAGGFLAHTFLLLNHSEDADLPPLLSSSRDWLLVLAWLVTGFYLFITVCDRKLSIGIFMLPLVLVLVASSYFVSEATNTSLTVQRGWSMLHAAALALGSGGVLVSIVLSLMYLIQHRRLRRGQVASVGLSLPNLERLARLNWWAVVISVPLLTTGMVTGLVLLLLGTGNGLSLADPAVALNGLSWLGLTGVFAWMLLTPRATGKQVAWRTLLTCGFLLLTLVGLSVLTGSHALAPEAAAWNSPVGGAIA